MTSFDDDFDSSSLNHSASVELDMLKSHPPNAQPFDMRRATDDTASDVSGPYQVIEYDLHEHDKNGNNNNNILADLEALHIQDDSPAAAALRANASVKVSRTGKAARAVHMNQVRKIVKRATGTTRSGVTRGKPPRLPPTINEGGVEKLVRIDETSNGEGVEEEEDDDGSDDEDGIVPPPTVTSVLSRKESHIPEGVVAGTVAAGNKGK